LPQAESGQVSLMDDQEICFSIGPKSQFHT